MLHCDFRRHTYLLRATTHKLSKACCRHRTRYANFTLTANLCARDRRVSLVKTTDCARSREVTDVIFFSYGLDELIVVSQYRRDDATRTVSWCCHNTATCCVLFVYCESEHVYPINNRHWIVRCFFRSKQLLTKCCCTTRHA
uniref:Uncharacterized protein n=1 Tax=Vibrio sp. DAT722 TaxID=344879 RepID=Q2FA26_9VIBR|nr:hypothetical protein [Vibrio sp. DAT722]